MRRGFAAPLVLIGITLLVVIAGGVYYLGKFRLPTSNQVPSGISSPNPTNGPATDFQKQGTPVDHSRKTGEVAYFLSDWIDHYPKFKALLGTGKVTNAFLFGYKKTLGHGWIIETNTNEKRRVFLLTPDLEKELTGPMSSNVEDDGSSWCTLNDVKVVGNENGLGRDLNDKNGYVVLNGTCNGYGGGNFVSIFKVTSGDKIRLQGSFGLFGTAYNAMSASGNALGRVRGIYGVTNPVLIVEFGSFESAATPP